MSRSRPQRGQATVELALLLPVVVLVLLLVLQAGMAVRDRLVVQHAARTAARAVIVDPDEAAARRALGAAGLRDRVDVSLQGERRPGAMVTVVVSKRPTAVPVLGRLVAGDRVRAALTVMVE